MDFKAKLYDRKRPDVAIAEINKVLSELLSNNVTINKSVEKIIIKTSKKSKIFAVNQLDTDVSSLGYIKESDLDTAVSALGYIKKSELESWLTEHGYQPQQ